MTSDMLNRILLSRHQKKVNDLDHSSGCDSGKPEFLCEKFFPGSSNDLIITDLC